MEDSGSPVVYTCGYELILKGSTRVRVPEGEHPSASAFCRQKALHLGCRKKEPIPGCCFKDQSASAQMLRDLGSVSIILPNTLPFSLMASGKSVTCLFGAHLRSDQQAEMSTVPKCVLCVQQSTWKPRWK